MRWNRLAKLHLSTRYSTSNMSFDHIKASVEEHFDKNPILHGHGHHKKGERNPVEEKKILDWILHVLGDKSKSKEDFAHYIQDGCVLSKVMDKIVYNAVPKDELEMHWGCAPQVTRVNDLIDAMKKYGVKDVFKPDDLLKLKDIGKVTRNLTELARLAAQDKGNILPKA